MVEAVVEYHYEAQQPDELTLKKGDIISNIVKKPGGWWEGTLARIGKRGMFPDNFVKVLGEKKPDSPDRNHQASGDKKAESPSKVPAGGRFCKVLFAYSPDKSDELELKVGDVIEILGEVEEGWWKGKLNNSYGVFPSNFVTEITRNNSINSSEIKKPRTSIDESSKLNHSTNSDEVTKAPSAENTMTKAEKDGEPLPALPPKPSKEQCKVMFPYMAANEDELTLEEGDIITIISKEAADDGWWTGELRGRIGVFPDNFVKLIPPQMTSVDDSKIGVKIKSNKDSISKSSSSASVYMAAAAAASSNQGSTSVSRKFSDSIRPSDDKPGSTASIGKKPPPPLKKPIGALSPSGVDKAPAGTVAAAIAKSEKAAAAAANSLTKPKDTSPTCANKSVVQNVVSSVTALSSKSQGVTMTSSVTTNNTSSSSESKWSVNESVSSDTHDGISFSRQSYSVTTSSGNSVPSNGSGVSLNNGTIAPLPPSELDLDSVPRTELLVHPTASRAKVPKRRPPSALLQREESRDYIEPVDSLVNGSTDQSTVEKLTSKAQSWLKELKEKQKDPKKAVLGGKTRVMIGASNEEISSTAISTTSAVASSTSSTTVTAVSSSTTATTASGVTLRERGGGIRPLSLHSVLPSFEPTSPPATETITVSVPHWNHLCNRVSKLEALVEAQQEELKFQLKEIRELLEAQGNKQRKMSADIEKLTDLVTQV